jgi:CRP/FNR family cyclic AMP-dependent transcriptional regulator
MAGTIVILAVARGAARLRRNTGAGGPPIRYVLSLSATTPSRHAAAPLLELAPALAARLTEDERRVASRLRVPVRTAFDGPLDLDGALRATGAFALLVVDGLLARAVSLGGHSGLCLLGPGDLVDGGPRLPASLVSGSELRASGPVRYAALDDRVLGLAQRYPRVVEGLLLLVAEQQQRMTAQLLVCQLPRVQDRVLALMWLLAESWGRVTASGVVLPLRLTHDTIGSLVGARRSTVTLALGQLERRGALVRRADDWLILERLRSGQPSAGAEEPPTPVVRVGAERWQGPPGDSGQESPQQRLRTRHAAVLRRSRSAIAASERATRRSHELVARIAGRPSTGRGGIHQQDGAGDLLAARGPRGPER